MQRPGLIDHSLQRDRVRHEFIVDDGFLLIGGVVGSKQSIPAKGQVFGKFVVSLDLGRALMHGAPQGVAHYPFQQVRSALEERGLTRVWLHVDLDVLDQSILPAVDSPGSPGLSTSELSQLLSVLIRTARIAGVNLTIYDPDLDPNRRYAPLLVECVARGIVGAAPSNRWAESA
jgi:hypothetical protein